MVDAALFFQAIVLQPLELGLLWAVSSCNQRSDGQMWWAMLLPLQLAARLRFRRYHFYQSFHGTHALVFCFAYYGLLCFIAATRGRHVVSAGRVRLLLACFAWGDFSFKLCFDAVIWSGLNSTYRKTEVIIAAVSRQFVLCISVPGHFVVGLSPPIPFRPHTCELYSGFRHIDTSWPHADPACYHILLNVLFPCDPP